MAKLKRKIKSIATKQGLILGIAISLITILAVFYNWDLLLSAWFQFSKFIITVAIAIYAALLARKQYVHKFTFRDGFSAFFICIVVGLGIFTIINWILFDFVFTDAGRYINDTAIEMRKEQLEALGQTPENIQKAMDQLNDSYQFSFINQVKGYLINLVLYCLIAPIVALIFKTKKPVIR